LPLHIGGYWILAGTGSDTLSLLSLSIFLAGKREMEEKDAQRERERGGEAVEGGESYGSRSPSGTERLSDDKNGGIFIAAINAATISSSVVTKRISLRFIFALFIISMPVLSHLKNLPFRVKSYPLIRGISIHSAASRSSDDKRGAI